jgi:hypothetical protein
MRGQFNPQIQRRLVNTNNRRTSLAWPARAIGKFKRKSHPRYPFLAQASLYRALMNLERHTGLNLSNVRRAAYSQPVNIGTVRYGNWHMNAAHHNNRGRPHTFYITRNSTGNFYVMSYNPNTERYFINGGN